MLMVLVGQGWNKVERVDKSMVSIIVDSSVLIIKGLAALLRFLGFLFQHLW